MTYSIIIGMHPSGKGFSITVKNSAGFSSTYFETTIDIGLALKRAYFLKSAIEQECNGDIPDENFCIDQDALERNAALTPTNLKVYCFKIPKNSVPRVRRTV